MCEVTTITEAIEQVRHLGLTPAPIGVLGAGEPHDHRGDGHPVFAGEVTAEGLGGGLDEAAVFEGAAPH